MINSYKIGYITKDTINISISWNVSEVTTIMQFAILLDTILIIQFIHTLSFKVKYERLKKTFQKDI